jgi:hypothetical protein
MKWFITCLVALFFVSINFNLLAQEKNKGIFVEPKPGFFQEIKKGIEEFNKPEKPARKRFVMDFTGIDIHKRI